ncbi:SgcJ/EcaC family oxidoreductase [Iamia sp. SCSIO 61187]|uniref:YybH family protein n=1 Tax=Iamia sp. SCSIO 61187 TaxID=2722752 RepID=UPI001C6345D0|nr:SgcJ/EcaC family oxidoreductase [Iamia sp. SCSIO 61187]QYG94931.1 SgcJ/EcaC family oxidoreductase [Iamia sp. SCSIO 61187]
MTTTPVDTTTATTDEEQVRILLERWFTAVQEADLAGVLAGHADDIVMFDVPPPDAGVRGRDAYRATWPPFLEWQSGDGVFELVELDVTVGDTVAFAWALLRCGPASEVAAHPHQRLRLTVGLEKRSGRWVVTHEHHSFPDRTP